MENLSPWDELLIAMGKTVENIGKSMQRQGRPTSEIVSLDQLKEYHKDLQSCATVLGERIQTLEEGK